MLLESSLADLEGQMRARGLAYEREEERTIDSVSKRSLLVVYVVRPG